MVAHREALMPRHDLRLDGEAARHAVQVAPRIWWVGAVLADDPFQCHAFLVEAGNQSVFIDPGSTLTIHETLRKVREVVALESIATILLHHSDPDCADGLHVLDHELSRPDVTVLTEWRSSLLLRHYDCHLEHRLIEEQDWKLDLGDGRELQFVMTPYLHFPGAFTTFEPTTGSLFSADLFGGFSRSGYLWARHASDFEDLREFHEHYMPDREILMAGLSSIRSRCQPIRRVLPQHGYLIPEPLVESMFGQLMDLECGIFLHSRQDVHLARLLQLAGVVRRIDDALDEATTVGELAEVALRELRHVVPVESVWAELELADGSDDVLTFHADDEYQGAVGPPRDPAGCLSLDLGAGDHAAHAMRIVVPVGEDVEFPPELLDMIQTLTPKIRAVLTRAADTWELHDEQRTLRDAATHDALTGLSNRHVLDDAPRTLPPGPLAVLMVDIDHFKAVNDALGHQAGDAVLQHVAAAVSGAVRGGDLVVRYGGEELLVVGQLDVTTKGDVDAQRHACAALGERIRRNVAALDLDLAVPGGAVTVSVGGSLLHTPTALDAAVQRADEALYQAKRSGRNRVVTF